MSGVRHIAILRQGRKHLSKLLQDDRLLQELAIGAVVS